MRNFQGIIGGHVETELCTHFQDDLNSTLPFYLKILRKVKKDICDSLNRKVLKHAKYAFIIALRC